MYNASCYSMQRIFIHDEIKPAHKWYCKSNIILFVMQGIRFVKITNPYLKMSAAKGSTGSNVNEASDAL